MKEKTIKEELEIMSKWLEQLINSVENLTLEYEKLIKYEHPQPAEAQNFLQKATLEFSKLSLRRAKVGYLNDRAEDAYEVEKDTAYMKMRDEDKSISDSNIYARELTRESKEIYNQTNKIKVYFKDLLKAVEQQINSSKKLLADWQNQNQNIKYNQD